MSKTMAALRGIAHGASGGLSDYLSTGLAYGAARLGGYEPTYQELLDIVRQQNAEAEQQNPGAYLAGEVAGAFVPAAGAGAIAVGNKARALRRYNRETVPLMAEKQFVDPLHRVATGQGTVADQVKAVAMQEYAAMLEAGIPPALAREAMMTSRVSPHQQRKLMNLLRKGGAQDARKRNAGFDIDPDTMSQLKAANSTLDEQYGFQRGFAAGTMADLETAPRKERNKTKQKIKEAMAVLRAATRE